MNAPSHTSYNCLFNRTDEIPHRNVTAVLNFWSCLPLMMFIRCIHTSLKPEMLNFHTFSFSGVHCVGVLLAQPLRDYNFAPTWLLAIIGCLFSISNGLHCITLNITTCRGTILDSPCNINRKMTQLSAVRSGIPQSKSTIIHSLNEFRWNPSSGSLRFFENARTV